MKYPGAYYNTMLVREDGGEGGENAFWQEDQNEPKGTSNLAFKNTRCWEEWPEKLTKLKLAVDPSQGKNDPAAYCAGGTLNGALFIKDGMLANHGSAQTIDQIVWFVKKYPEIEEIILESNLFKDILKTQLEKRLSEEKDENGNSCYRHVDNHYAGENKHIRIMKMEPDATGGKILLNPFNAAFNKNVKEYHAKVSHDDAPDCLQMLHSRLMSSASAWLEYARLQAEKIRGKTA
jgi:predicted phage terminase large subunit-like protein